VTAPPTIIDFHTHLDDRWFDRPLMDTRAFLAGLDRCGVRAACVFTLMGFYKDCRRHNDLLRERCAAAPERLWPFITVDPKLGPAAVAELERCIASGRFKGVKFHPWLQAFAPSMVKATIMDILRRAAAAGLPVLFHDGTPPYSTTFQIAATARWVPEATVVLGHAGLADYCVPAAQLVRDIPNLYACVCGPRAGDVRHLVDVAGPDKVLFGSDFGQSDWMILEDRLDAVRFAGLSEAESEAVLWRNAARLLNLREGEVPAEPRLMARQEPRPPG
jgi:predicted TIM-barrel fold metal-dependent hydrolase